MKHRRQNCSRSRQTSGAPELWRVRLRGTTVAVVCLILAVAGSVRGDVPEEVLQAQQERIDAIARAKAAAVSVFARGGAGGGSGVVISPDGYALTNYHVVKPAGNFMKCSMPDDVLYDAVVVGIDPVGDVALIKLFGREDFPHAELGDSDELRAGDWCFAVGNPFLLATDFQPTVTWGLVSGVHRYQPPAGSLLEYADCIQTDASINPGNSGGPLFNARGQLVGINGRGSFEKRGRVNVGVGYAISINQIKNFMGYLKSGRIVDHATLGATVATDEEGRVVVSNILSSSDAWRRGLRYGDEILEFGGRQIGTVNAFKNVLGIFPKGWRVPLSFRRDGERNDIWVRLAGVHAGDELIKQIQGEEKEQPRGVPIDGISAGAVQQAEPKKEGDGGGEDKDANDDDPGDKPKPPGPGRPIQLPGQPQAGPPPGLAKYFKARRGYANFYFNELNQDRVWKRLVARGDFTGQTGEWVIRGDFRGAAMEITLNEKQLTGDFPGFPPARVALDDPEKLLDEQLAPAGSGGLLAALYVWRRFITVGPGEFGDTYYSRHAEAAGPG